MDDDYKALRFAAMLVILHARGISGAIGADETFNQSAIIARKAADAMLIELDKPIDAL